MTHLLVRGDRAQWEREKVTARDQDGVPLLDCFHCWVPLRPGHRVALRDPGITGAVATSSGRQGIVVAVDVALDAHEVEFDDRTRESFPRSRLACLHGQRVP